MKFKTVKKEHLVFNDNEKVSVNTEDRSFRGVAYSGNVIKDHPYWGNLAFDISTMTAKSKIPILYNHDMDKVVGTGSLTFGSEVIVEGVISSETQYGKESYHLIKDIDFPMQESVYIEPDSVITLKQGATMTVNGREIVGPGTVFKGGKIKEVSLTPLGADSETSTTMFNTNEEIKILEEETMTEEMKKFTELFAESPEEAFKFACQCEEEAQKKKKKTKVSDDETEAKEDKSEELEAANARIAELEAENDALKAEKSEKASLERKEKLEKVFSDLGVTLNEELLSSYQEMGEERFSKVFSSLKADAEKVVEQKNKKIEDLTKFKEVDTADKSEDEKRNEVFSLARKIREESKTDIAVAASLEMARKQLNITE